MNVAKTRIEEEWSFYYILIFNISFSEKMKKKSLFTKVQLLLMIDDLLLNVPSRNDIYQKLDNFTS